MAAGGPNPEREKMKKVNIDFIIYLIGNILTGNKISSNCKVD